MDKNKVTAIINGRMYTLVSEETADYMKMLSDKVNEKVDFVKKNNPTLLGERPIVLAALNICDDYYKAESGGKIMIENLERKYNELAEENKKLRDVLNNSEYEIEVSSLMKQLEDAKNEIAALKSKIAAHAKNERRK